MAERDNKGNLIKKEIENIEIEEENGKNVKTDPVLDQNQKVVYWDSPDGQKEILLFPGPSMERDSNQTKQQQLLDNLKTSSTQLFQSDINLLQRTQISSDNQTQEEQLFLSNVKDQQSLIMPKYVNDTQTHKQSKLNNNFQTITELSSCINNSLLNNDIGSPQSQYHQSIQETTIRNQDLNLNLQTPQLKHTVDVIQVENNFQLNDNQEYASKSKKIKDNGESLEDLVSVKSSSKSIQRRQNNFSENSSKRNKKDKHGLNINEEQEDFDNQQPTKVKFTHKQKTFTEKIIDKVANIVNGSQNQTYAEEDKHLQKQQNEIEFLKQEEFQEKLTNRSPRDHRKSIRLFTLRKIKRQSQSTATFQDFDQIINENRSEYVGVKRRTYTEFNSLMKQQTLEYENQFQENKDQIQEIDDDDDEEIDGKSDINSEKGNNQIGQTEEEMQKQKIKKKFRRKKKIIIDEHGGEVALKEDEPIKYDYPFPYNIKIQQKEEEQQFRHVDDDLKDEYEYYSKLQQGKQEKNRELMIYAVKKNEFEMLTLLADHYPLLQLRKVIMLISRFISWVAYKIIKYKWFERVVLFVILFNTVVQCMDDPTSNVTTPTIDKINMFFLVAYTIECSLKILGLGFIINKGSYLRDGWNILDFTIVFTSLLPYMIGANSGVNLSSLRSLRVLRPLKTISKIRSLKIVLLALFSSFPYLVNAIIILIFFYLIFAIAGLQLFMGLLKRRCFDPETGIILLGNDDQPCGGQYNCPSDYVCGKMFNNPIYGVFNFDNIMSSFLMVFVCVTLESWSQIMYYVFDSFTAISVIYFVVLCFIGAFFLINLTLAVIKAKFTKPEDYKEDELVVDPQDIIDMHRLKMFRRMERNHLKRKLLAKKQVLMDLELSDDGLYFNWEDLMKLKIIQDKEDQEMAKQEEREQIIEKQIMMKEKLKQKLKKAITKDALFKKYKLDTIRERQLPHQKIVFYVGKEQGEIISQATLNEIEHHQQHHAKKRGSVRQSSMNFGSRIFGLADKNIQKQQKGGRKSSIQLQCEPHFQDQIPSQKKEMHQIQFLGVQRGIMTPVKGQPKLERNKSQIIQRNSQSILQQEQQHHHHYNQNSHQNPSHSNHPLNQFGNQILHNLVNEEDDQKIFDRFDEINRLEIEEFKKYEKENGRVDMDEFFVINNQNLKRLRKLPDLQTSLSILSLKQPKIRNDGDESTKFANGFKNIKQIITEDDFITTPTLIDQISKQITKSSLKSTSDNIQQDQECFAQLNQELQEIHENKQTPNSMTTTGFLNSDTPLNNQRNDNDENILLKLDNKDEITFQDFGQVRTTQNDELKTNENIYLNDKSQEANVENKLIINFQNQQGLEDEEQDSNKSLGIIDHDSVEEQDSQKIHKNSYSQGKNFSKKSPACTPKKRIHRNHSFKFGISDDYSIENHHDSPKHQNTHLQNENKIALYDEDEEDDEDIWVEENVPVRPSIILKNIYNYQINSQKNNMGSNEAIQEEQVPQQTEIYKKSDSRRPSRLDIQGKVGSLIQIQMNKKKLERKQTKQIENDIFIQDENDQLTPAQIAQKALLKKNVAKRASRASIHHNVHNIEAQMALKQGHIQRDQSRHLTHAKKGNKMIKPLQNVRHWKIMIDMKKEYKSNSQSDILFHRLKAEQDNKIDEEQVKIRNTKYQMTYRLRAIKKISKRLRQRMKKEKKSKLKNSKSLRKGGVKGFSRSITMSNKQGGKSNAAFESESSLSKSSGMETSDFNFFITQDELQTKFIRLPIRRTQVQDELSSAGMNTLQDFEEQSIGSNNKSIQMNSFASKDSSQLLIRQRMKSRQARVASTKEKVVFSYDNIKKLLQENIVKVQYKGPLESVTNKSVYWDIRRIDYNLGIKNINIWSGSNVTRQIIRNKLHTNKILRQLCTDKQDLHVWVAGFKGLVSVLHKHIKNFVLSNTFNGLSMMCVFMNTAVLAMGGSFSDQTMLNFLSNCNDAFSYIFIGEMGMKIIAFGPLGYVRDKINLFDGLIVSISLVEMIVFSGGSKAVSAFRAVRIFRTFRVLRVTRLLRSLQFMSVIMSVINRTIDSFMYIALLLFLFIFIYSLLGMQIYGGSLNFADNGGIRQNFDSFYDSFLCTFQIVTLENWPDILVITLRSQIHPAITAIYLISWIFIGNYVFLNLFLAILLDGFVVEGDDEEMNMLNQDEDDGDESDIDEQIQSKILKMNKKQIREEKKKQNQEQEFLMDIKQQQEQFDIDSDTNLEQLFEEKVDKKVHLFHGIECRDSLFMFSKSNSLRIQCYKIVQSHHFENFILALIITSSLKLVVDTYLDDSNQQQQLVSYYIDIIFNSIFILECVSKIIAYGLCGDENSYLTDPWSQLDCFIVLASLLDMSVASINLPVIKILRLLRTLRPLRFISHNVNMKVVVIALFESVGAIANVLVVVLLIWLMFAILGISLIGGRMGYCDMQDYYGINIETCTLLGKSWKVFDTNFDNITNSMVTLLILSTLENWPNMMFQAQDSDLQDYGPTYKGYTIIGYFYIVFILVGSFFLINLFIGVIFLKFTEAQKSQKISIFLTEKQARWIEFQMMIIGVKAQFQQNKKPESKFRLFFWRIVNFQGFDLFIMLCIVANIITMGLSYEGSTPQWDQNLSYINYFFTAVFVSEMLLKVLSIGFQTYFQNGWNKFDFFVVCSSIIDITMDLMGGQSLSFLRVGPQLARVVRVFRVTRLLKLVRSMRGLQKLIETLLFSLPSLVNVGALMLLFFFIFSILGVFLFKDIITGQQITSYNNFHNFGNAMITLFRSSTGENWQYIMFDVGNSNNCKPGGVCYTQFAIIYYVFFILVCVFIMLNLFILVLIQYFEDYHMKEDNPLDAFNENLEVFRSVWVKYTAFSSGTKISTKHIVNFLSELPTPLGYYEENPDDQDDRIDKHQIAKEVMDMKLPDDGFGNVFFNDCLFSCMKKAYGAEIVNDGAIELKKFLIKQEYETKKKIEEKKRQLLIKQKQKIFNDVKNLHVNPIVLMLFCGMAFKSWRNYIDLMKDDDGKIDKEYSLSSSSSSSSPSPSDSDEDSEFEGDDDDDDENNHEDAEQQEQQYDDYGNPINSNTEDNEDQDAQAQQDYQNGSHKSLEDIHEHSSEDEDEEENVNVNALQIEIPKSVNNKKQKKQITKTNIQHQKKSSQGNDIFQGSQNTNSQKQIEEKQEIYQDVETKQTYQYKPMDKSSKKHSSSDDESNSDSDKEKKEEILERGGYDENEDFIQQQEKEKKWKQKELLILTKNNMLSINDKDQENNFLKTPKYFEDNEQNQFDDIDTPVHFKPKNSKKRKSKDNKKPSSFK